MNANGAPGGWAALPEPGSADAPKYWRDETSGHLALAVERWLTEPEAMTLNDIRLMRAYCVQWVDAPAWHLNPHAGALERAALQNLRLAARHIYTAKALAEWLARAEAIGMDPL
jgi:hypothetical protein